MGTTKIVAEPGVPQIVMSREFDAPRDLLFRAFTEPERIVQWFGPQQLTTTVELNELRDGGHWRLIQRDADGREYRFHGVYHGTPSVSRIVRTFEFEGMPDHVSLETATFEERGGRTLLRLNAVFQSVGDRDAQIDAGMEEGATESMDRLAELIARLTNGGG